GACMDSPRDARIKMIVKTSNRLHACIRPLNRRFLFFGPDGICALLSDYSNGLIRALAPDRI
ncbi:MAG: hypothetical protein J0H87_00045, partial [Holosporales bacterium]|nr:hypothetical protein [Holosporales bacterium]